RVPFRALIDPRFDRGNLGGFQRIAFHRHRRLVEAGDDPVDLAALRVARNKSSAVRTTFDGCVAAAEVELRQLERRPMTVPAALLEDWLNVAGKVEGPRGRSSRCGRLRAQHDGNGAGG